MTASLSLAAPRFRRVPPRDWLIAAAVTAVAQAEVWLAGTQDHRAAYAVAALAITLPLVWRRLAPVAVLVASLLPLFALKLAGDGLEYAYVMVVLLVVFSATGLHAERGRAVVGLGVGVALLAGLLALEHLVAAEGEPPPGVGDFIFLSAIGGVVWGLGVALRDRSSHADQLAARAQDLERDREARARAAVAEERARIARELHDVVAHSISVIAVQTGSVRRRLVNGRPADPQELQATEDTARQALAEMRRMLGLLRADDEGLSLAPQPGVADVGALVANVRGTGLPAELEVTGDRRGLPPGVDLAAYRIVQEALTNVIKHARGASARVAVRYGPHAVEVEVCDDGRGGGESSDGGGHGLVGMRERVALYGGTLEAGPAQEGGFRVRATLPTAAA